MRDPMWKHNLPTPADLESRVVVEVIDGLGSIYGRGELVSFTDRPTMTLQRDDGSHFSWIADLGWRIIPQPKVGDVVTADMNLPVDTIAECKANLMRTRLACRVDTVTSGAQWDSDGDWYTTGRLICDGPWRIVRIGAAS